MKKKKQNRFPDYDIVEMEGVVSFGTNVWIRKDKLALAIVFPCGQTLHFKPEDEIKICQD